MSWKLYQRKPILAEMRPYEQGEDLSGVSVSPNDREKGSPKVGDMIARDPSNHNDRWLVNSGYVAEKFEPEAIGDA